MLTLATIAALIFLPQATPNCIWDRSSGGGRTYSIPDAGRRSPKDSLTFQAGGATVKVCYSRPSLRGRTMIGGSEIPYGRIWRTGANEATMIHTTGHLVIAGLHVDAGTYAIYTVPGEREWEIVINRSYMQWGHESYYTDSVRTQELGRGRVPVTRLEAPVERLSFRAEPQRNGDANLIIEWDRARVVVPVQRMR